MNNYLPYNPGVLPSRSAPATGESIIVYVKGLPPYKDEHFSIRNPRHKNYLRFEMLRETAIESMGGRAPYRGPVRLDFVMYGAGFEPNRRLADYMGGIMDTFDGSHGADFTYLPIVYEDDCQVCDSKSEFIKSENEHYQIEISFLSDT